MKHVLAKIDHLKRRLSGCNVALFLDFDGTLAHIAEHPNAVSVNPKLKKILSNLVLTPGIFPAVISGRKLSDLRSRLKVRGMIYAGNHGMELSGPGMRFFKPVGLDSRMDIKKIYQKLKTAYAEIPGVFLEDKGYTLSVHYRKLDPGRTGLALKVLRKIILPYRKKRKIKITSGKKVWEIRPPVGWNKGSVVVWVMDHLPGKNKKYTPVFIGDDKTDEDAFKAVKKTGIGVKVTKKGEEWSNASYFLKDPGEVLEFLRILIQLKKIR